MVQQARLSIFIMMASLRCKLPAAPQLVSEQTQVASQAVLAFCGVLIRDFHAHSSNATCLSSLQLALSHS